MTNELASIMAIQECMDCLQLRRDKEPTQGAHAQVLDKSGARMPGSLLVTFNCNQHSGQGPYVEMGDEIRGYGIHYNVFRPQFQTFTFNESETALTIAGNGYEFTLRFQRSA